MSVEQNKYCYPTTGQLERDISQKLNSIYQNQFAHRASRVDCHLLDNKIMIFSEEVITPIERLLLEASSSSHLVHQIRTFLDNSIKTKIEELIKEIVQVEVRNCIYNTDIDTKSAIAIAILANPPRVRSKRITRRGNKKNVVQFNHSRDRLSESI